jgi:hypothetical protein
MQGLGKSQVWRHQARFEGVKLKGVRQSLIKSQEIGHEELGPSGDAGSLLVKMLPVEKIPAHAARPAHQAFGATREMIQQSCPAATLESLRRKNDMKERDGTNFLYMANS